jgi:glucose-6-phosphate isomerase, archaeal
MSFPEPVQAVVNPFTGELAGASRRYQKRLRDLDGLYRDQSAFASLAASRGEEVAYEVYEFRPNENPGDLIFGTSILYPGKVGDEYFMTRGHIHAKSDRSEIYYCQSGSGVMLMETPPGETRAIEMKPQTVVYVPPHWIHRSVNTGVDILVTFFCYPADSGQDYEIIARTQGMKVLIVGDHDGGWRQIPNPAYRPRSEEQLKKWSDARVRETIANA